jgi:alkyl hydroperoxide reductase subunit F
MKSQYPQVFDTIIIGGGPAGMTAAVYAARRKMKALLICGTVGGQMRWSSDIENYTGIAQATGPEMTKIFMDHIRKVDEDDAHYDLWVREDEKVEKIEKNNEIFTVTTGKGNIFQAYTLTITTGKVPRTLEIPGEKIAMQGNGLSFCATCDAPLYKNKKMAVIGGGNSAMDVAIQLSKFTPDVTIFTNLNHLIGETCLMEKIKNHPGIHVEYGTNTTEILLNAENKVSGIEYKQNGEEKIFECEGIFEEIGQIPATYFLDGIVDLNDNNEIITNVRKQTSTPGIFAGGDCTDQPHKQVIVAAGEGAIAVLEAHEYLLRHEKVSYVNPLCEV